MGPSLHSFITKFLPALVLYAVAKFIAPTPADPHQQLSFIAKYNKELALLLTALGLGIIEAINYLKKEKNIDELRIRMANMQFEDWLKNARLKGAVKPELRIYIMTISYLPWPRWVMAYESGMLGWCDQDTSYNLKQGFVSFAKHKKKGRNQPVIDDFSKMAPPAKKAYFKETLRMSRRQIIENRYVKAACTIILYKDSGFPYGAFTIDATDLNGAEFLMDPDIRAQLINLGSYAHGLYQDR
jgi:hypothetical protein